MRTRAGWLLALVVAAVFAVTVAAPEESDAGAGVDIYVVGGAAAVSDAVVDALEACTSGVVQRVAGPNRFATAAAVSATTFPTPGVPVAFITRADIYPDALSAVPAASIRGGPILLVNPSGVIPSPTATELARLQPESIIVLGGSAAVSDAIVADLAAFTTGPVTRIGGSDRYSTSALVSQSQFAPGVDVAYVVSGDNFPDAMVTGVFAALSDAPVLLTRPTGIPAPIASELTRLDPGSITIAGGTAVLPPRIQTDLEAFASEVDRIAGIDRYATAAEISQAAFPDPSTVDTVWVGRGDDFADVLPAGVAAAQSNAPLLLVRPDGVPTATAEELVRLTGADCGTALNSPPTANDDAGLTTPEDTPLSTPSVLTNDSDPDGNALTISSFAAISTAGGTVVHDGDGVFAYTPPSDFNGADSFTYTATDGSETDAATVSITVTPVNDLPVAVADAVTVDEGATATELDSTNTSVRDNDTDVEDGTPTGDVSLVTDAVNGAVTLDADGTFSYTHDGSETTTDSFTYTVADSAGAPSNEATVLITITPVNDDPVANDDAMTVGEGGTTMVLDSAATSVAQNDTDAEDGSPTGDVSLVTDVVNGDLTLNPDGTFSYTHDGSETTSDSFTYTVDDSDGATSDVATVTVTITGDNDAPVGVGDQITVDEGGTATTLDPSGSSVRGNDTDAEDGTPTGDVSLVTDVVNGDLTLNPDGTFSYTHDGSETTSDSFTYTVDDSDGASSSATTVTITIDPVNDAPLAVGDAITVDEGATATELDSTDTSVRANDTDAEDGTPTGDVTLVTDVVNGDLTLNANGTFSYAHDGSETTSDSFTYTVADSEGLVSNEATVVISITPVNDAPVASDSSETTDEDSTVVGTFDVTDADGDDPATMTYGVDQPAKGTVTDNGDGTFTFDPNGEFESLRASESEDVEFTYSVTDQSGAPSAADGAVTITVTGVDDNAPLEVTKSVEGRQILYRVNAGGAEVPAIDGGPAWTQDTPGNPSPWIAPGYTAHQDANTSDSITVTGVPAEAQIEALFQTERWDQPAAPPMGYAFPVAAGRTVEVRLYFAEIYDPITAAGDRVFDVTIDGVPFLTGYDQFAEAGLTQNVALVESAIITSDGSVDIEFAHDAQNPAIKAIELTAIGDVLPEPGGLFTYTVTIENPAGNSESATVSAVTDSIVGDIVPFCGTPFPVLAPGESVECVFDQTHTAPGDYVDTVTVAATGDTTDEDLSAISNEVTATVTIVPDPVEVTKVGTPLELVEPGGFVDYTVTVTNPVTNADVTVTAVEDDRDGVVVDISGSCTPALPATLAPGDSLTCDFTLEHLGLGGDTFPNTATAIAEDAAGIDVSASSDEVVAAIVNAAAEVRLTPTGGLDASTFTAGSLEIENTGIGVDIVSVTIDIGTGLFPDAVFDPLGTAGDVTGKPLTADAGAAATGYVAPSDPGVDPFSIPHNGVDGSDGWDALTVDFTDFDPGEVFTFSVDIDPNNIKNAVGTGGAGAVSGLELTGAEVTVEFSDGSIVTNDTFRIPASAGGAVAVIDDPVPPSAGIDGVTGVTLASIGPDRRGATVTDAAQTVTVTGPADTDVILLVVEGGLTTGASYLVEEFDANEALGAATITEYPATTGPGGTVDIPVTLTRSSADGGYNLMTAVVVESGVTGPSSGHLVLILDETASATGVGGGESVTTDGDGDGASGHDPVEVTVTTPSSGTYDIEIVEGGTTTSSGFTLLGHEVDLTISATAPSAADPFTFTFELDASLVGGTVDVLKDGVLVPACLAAGTAAPDPCVESSTTQPDGDLAIVVLSTTASLWNFATDAAPGDLGATPNPLDFGTVDIGTSPTLDITLENLGLAGNGPITVSDVTISGDPAFTLDPAPTLPIELDPAGTTTIGVQFTPVADGAVSGSVELTHTGANSPTTVNIDGIGETPVATVLYRVNNGGPEVAAIDGGPAWTEDQSASTANGSASTGTPSPYLASAGDVDKTFGVTDTITTTATPDVPEAVFQMERYHDEATPPMTWAFPVDIGAQVQVNLYFAEVWSGAAGGDVRVFEIDVEGVTIEAAYDPAVVAGGAFTSTVVSDTVTSDGTVDIALTQIAGKNNPAIKGIEIVELVPAPVNVPPAFDQDLGDRTDTEGDVMAVDAGAIDPDGFPLALDYGATGLPPGLGIDPGTGLISGTIDVGAAAGSPYSVEITVTDGLDTDVDTFTWTVDPAAPIVAAEYRVNVGGPELTAADGTLPVWSEDTNTNASPYRTLGSDSIFLLGGTNSYPGPIDDSDPTIPAGAPTALFESERWDAPAAPSMTWEFPVANGTYEVRLYFAELFDGVTAAGERVFDVSLEGAIPPEFDDIDPWAGAPTTASVRSATATVTDGTIDLVFLHGQENPALKGIEIIDVGGLSPDPSSHDFGQVAVGDPQAIQTFTITNTSDSTAIETTQISISGDPSFGLANVPPPINTINPGESYTFDVTFDPTTPGVVGATVEILHTGEGGDLTLPVTGEGIDDSAGAVLYRVNTGGGAVTAIDGGSDWESDAGGSSAYRTGGDTSTSGGNTSNTWAPPPFTPAASTPNAVFGQEAYGDMNWNFPVTPGTPVEVRIFMQNSWTGSDQPGERVFDIAIDGTPEWTGVDLSGTHGHLTAVMYTTSIVADADGVDIDFITGTANNPLVNAIELVVDVPQPGVLDIAPAVVDFGTEIIGGVGQTTVTLTNRGDTGDPDISIADGGITLDNGDFSHSFMGALVLGPGQTAQFDVSFTPSSAGAQVATLTVVHDGVNNPTTATFEGNGASSVPPGFSNSELSGESSNNPTSLQFGPDGRLYVSQQNGLIHVYTIVRNGPDDYDVTATETITDVQDITNHDDDDGAVSSKQNRQVTGLLVTGTATNPVLYVSSSDPQIAVGSDSNLDTNSGTISRLTWTGTVWDHVQLVRGLPRSEENHASNGMALDEANNTLYLIQGGHTNMGAPGNKFAATPEYALSAALLSIDLDAIDALSTQIDGSGQAYKYDIPTLDDPTRPNTGNTYTINGVVVNEDVGDPFGGNDGLNQAAWISGGPVEVYSPGYRNAYDVVFTEAGRLYTFDNGPNGGWGGIPINEGPGGACTNEFNDNNSSGYGDGLHFISGAGYYGGHPNPVRGNPLGSLLYKYVGATDTLDGSLSPNPLDFGATIANPVPFANPVECDYISPVEAGSNDLAVIGASTNGLAEYTATNFGGEMVGDLLAASFDDKIYRFELNAAGDTVTDSEALFSGFGGNPLDVTAQGDGDIFSGTVWVAMHGADTIEVFEPNDYDGGGGTCIGGPGSMDEDGDGFTNDDELANGTDPCSAGSAPNDYDGDDVSDLLDTDDDNDGDPDTSDPFAIDADNGSTTPLPASCPAKGAPGSSTATCLHMHAGEFPGTILNLGFTGIMTNGTDDWLDLMPGDLVAGGAASALSVQAVPPGDAFQATNTQKHGYQFGFDPGATPFVLHTRVIDPLSGTPDTFMSAGMQFGPGDQDDYIKLVVSAYADSANGIQLGTEIGGSFSPVNTEDAAVVGSPVAVDLWLHVDPSTGQVDAEYAVDGGTVQTAGSTTAPLSWFSGGLALGTIATSNGAAPFEVSWERLEAWQPGSGVAEAQVAISGASTYDSDSMQITNTSTGGVTIDSVSFDLAGTFLPDIVFDPDGTAGDATAKCLTVDTEGGTGFMAPSDPCVDPFSDPHQGGYFEMAMGFGDFDPGETVGFSVDVDPTSIQGNGGAGGAGSVGGFELTGTTVTVGFSNGETWTGTLVGDGAGNDSSATVRAGLPGAPTAISVLGVAPVPTIVGTETHTIRVEGPDGSEVTLFEVEAELDAGVFDIDPFEANSYLTQALQTATISGGFHDFTVTLADTDPAGALNHYIAVLTDADGNAGSAASETIVLEYDDASGGTVVQRINAGGSLVAGSGGIDWEADTSGANHPDLTAPGTNDTGSFDGTSGGTVPAGTPDAIWDSERYSSGAPFTYTLSVTPNSEVLLRLYVNNGWSGTSAPGARQFDVSVEGSLAVDDLDLSGTFGHQVGGVVTVRVPPADTADGAVTVTFAPGSAENPLVNAIEVIEF